MVSYKFKYSKFFYFFLSLSLIVANIPAVGLGRSFLAPPSAKIFSQSTVKKIVYGKTYELPGKIYDNVRLARPEDASDIFALSKLIWHESRGKSIGPDYYKQTIQNQNGRNGNYIWVYCDNTGKVQAYIYTMVLPGGKSVVVWEVAVSEDLRRQYIAKTLCAVAMMYMENVFSATLFSAYPNNKASMNMIEDFGFKCGLPGALTMLDEPICYKADFTDFIASKLRQPRREFPDSRALYNAMHAILLARRSTRNFDKEKTLDRIIVEVLIDRARNTLSNLHDMSDFDISIYDDPNIKQRLATEIKMQRPKSAVGVDVQPQPKDVPFSVVISVRKDALKANRNKTLCLAGMFIETILLSVTSVGIDSLWISSFNESKVKEICGNADSPFVPIAVVPLGNRSKNPRVAKRLPMEARIQRGTDSDLSLVERLLLKESRKVNVVGNDVRMVSNGKHANDVLTAILSDNLKYSKAMNILSHRYGGAPPLEPLTADIDYILERAMEAARWAPSARNLQSTDFIIIRDKQKIEYICKNLAIDYSTVEVLIIPTVNIERLKLITKTNANDTSTMKRAKEVFGYLDGGAAIQNILLSLSSMGYAAGWIFKKDIDTRTFESCNRSITHEEYLGLIAVKQTIQIGSDLHLTISENEKKAIRSSQ